MLNQATRSHGGVAAKAHSRTSGGKRPRTRLWRDCAGAAFLEYTLLMSLMLALITIFAGSYVSLVSGIWTGIVARLGP